MTPNDLLVDREKLYRLYAGPDGAPRMAVLCGGFAMYEIEFALSAEEAGRYLVEGKPYLDALSLDVVRHQAAYLARSPLRGGEGGAAT